MKIINLERGIASEGPNCKEKRRIGRRSPPPPIPPALDKADPISIKKNPKSSIIVGG